MIHLHKWTAWTAPALSDRIFVPYDTSLPSRIYAAAVQRRRCEKCAIEQTRKVT